MAVGEKANQWMAGEIFKVLTGLGHKIWMFDKNGKRVIEPSESKFIFSQDANMMIVLGWTGGSPAKPEVTFMSSDSTDPKVRSQIETTIGNLKLYDHSFSTKTFGRKLEPKHFVMMAKQDVSESAWHGSTRTSRWPVGMTEVVIRHNQRLDDSENPRRWTRIADIFIHGADGSRYKFPHKHILGAKALAQHMDQGNTPWDDGGQNISVLVRALLQLRKLKRWASVSQPDLVDTITATQRDIKTLLQQIAQPVAYQDSMNQAAQMSAICQQCETLPSHLPPETELAAGLLDLQVPQQTSIDASDVLSLDHEPEEDLTMFREARELHKWFDQFEIKKIYEQDYATEVMAASAETGSTDPRTVLDNLSQNIVGWSSRFEEDPMAVLSQIEDILDQIKKLGD